VLDSGAWSSYAVPIWEGWTVSSAVLRKDLGGEMVTQELMRLLQERQVPVHPSYTISKHPILPSPDSPPQFSIEYMDFPQTHPSFQQFSLLSTLRTIKETRFEVSSEVFLDEDYQSKPAASYIMPDGSTLDLGNERFKLQEVLFGGEKEGEGLGQLLSQSIDKCEPHMKKKLLENVVVCGGNTLFPHFTDRIHNELLDLTPRNTRIRLISAPEESERRYSSWLGGSILSALQAFQANWVSRKDFMEQGVAALERKCPSS